MEGESSRFQCWVTEPQFKPDRNSMTYGRTWYMTFLVCLIKSSKIVIDPAEKTAHGQKKSTKGAKNTQKKQMFGRKFHILQLATSQHLPAVFLADLNVL